MKKLTKLELLCKEYEEAGFTKNEALALAKDDIRQEVQAKHLDQTPATTREDEILERHLKMERLKTMAPIEIRKELTAVLKGSKHKVQQLQLKNFGGHKKRRTTEAFENFRDWWIYRISEDGVQNFRGGVSFSGEVNLKNYTTHWNNLFTFLCDHTETRCMSQITKENVNAYVSYIRGRADYAIKTKVGNLKGLECLLWSTAHYLETVKPEWRGLVNKKGLSGKPPVEKTLSDEEVSQVLVYMQSNAFGKGWLAYRNQAMVHFAMDYWRRVGEIVAELTWSDYLPNVGEYGAFRITPNKTGGSAEIHEIVNPETRLALDQYRMALVRQYGEEILAPENPLWIKKMNHAGEVEAWSKRNAMDTVRRIGKKLGFRFTVHMIRHTQITKHHNAGMASAEIASRTGQAIQTINQNYLHAKKSTKESAVRKAKALAKPNAGKVDTKVVPIRKVK